MCHGPLPHVHKDPGWSRCPIPFHITGSILYETSMYLDIWPCLSGELRVCTWFSTTSLWLSLHPSLCKFREHLPAQSLHASLQWSYPPSWSPTPFPTLKTLKSESSMLKLEHQSHLSGLHGDPTSTSQSLQPTYMSWTSLSVLLLACVPVLFYVVTTVMIHPVDRP